MFKRIEKKNIFRYQSTEFVFYSITFKHFHMMFRETKVLKWIDFTKRYSNNSIKNRTFWKAFYSNIIHEFIFQILKHWIIVFWEITYVNIFLEYSSNESTFYETKNLNLSIEFESQKRYYLIFHQNVTRKQNHNEIITVKKLASFRWYQNSK
jgi:hypothetical protein